MLTLLHLSTFFCIATLYIVSFDKIILFYLLMNKLRFICIQQIPLALTFTVATMLAARTPMRAMLSPMRLGRPLVRCLILLCWRRGKCFSLHLPVGRSSSVISIKTETNLARTRTTSANPTGFGTAGVVSTDSNVHLATERYELRAQRSSQLPGGAQPSPVLSTTPTSLPPPDPPHLVLSVKDFRYAVHPVLLCYLIPNIYST